MKYVTLVLISALGLGPLLVGCDDTLEHRKEVEVKDNGTVVQEEKKVTEKADGTIVKEETKDVSK